MKRRFGEPAHIARIYIGQNVNGPTGKVLRKVSPAENRQIEKLVTSRGSGALTKLKAAGIYYDSKRRKTYPAEQTHVIEIVSSAADSCAKFTKRAADIGRAVARVAKQDSALVMTECYGRALDASLVTREGAPRQLTRLAGVRTSSRRRR